MAHADVPILAVNLGSLGFLTEVPLAEMYSTLEAVNQGHCPVEERSVLQCQLIRSEECIAQHFALNDVVINKSAISRLVDFDLLIDGIFVFSYKADGVIIATPTGSTAYSLAAGGPIMMPAVEAFVVTPVCPHSLTHRPLVVTDKAQVEVLVESGEEQAFLSIDGQVGMPVLQGDRVICRRASHNVKLMRVRRTFFDVLRKQAEMGPALESPYLGLAFLTRLSYTRALWRILALAAALGLTEYAGDSVHCYCKSTLPKVRVFRSSFAPPKVPPAHSRGASFEIPIPGVKSLLYRVTISKPTSISSLTRTAPPATFTGVIPKSVCLRRAEPLYTPPDKTTGIVISRVTPCSFKSPVT